MVSTLQSFFDFNTLSMAPAALMALTKEESCAGAKGNLPCRRCCGAEEEGVFRVFVELQHRRLTGTA